MKNYMTNAIISLPMRLKIQIACLFFLSIAASQPMIAQCSPDILPPTAVCKTLVTHDVAAGSIIVKAQDFNNGSSDNCTPATSLSYFMEEGTPSATPPATSSLVYTSSQLGDHAIVCWVVDAAGNASNCTTTLRINHCDYSNSIVCNSDVYVQLSSVSHTATLTAPDGLEGTYCDFLTFQVQLDASLFASSIALNALDIGTHTYAIKMLPTQLTCYGLVHIMDYVPEHLIKGTVFIDANADCQQQSGSEAGLAGWIVQATGSASGHVFSAVTDGQGRYQIKVDTSEAQYEVVLDVPYNYGGNCGTTYMLNFPGSSVGDTIDLDIPVALDPVCPLLFVDLATPRIRPCFPGTYYIHYANASVFPISSTYVDVTLDPALAFQSGSIASVALGNQQYRFSTGNLNPGQSGQFSIQFVTDCAAPLGATHCSTAHIFPDTLCPTSLAWSGANIEVEGHCQNDSIFLKILNTGSGPNAHPLDFIVVEDVLMIGSGSFNLNAGEHKSLQPIPSTGATYRLQAQQEPGHPYGGMPAVAVEGCGGFTPGQATLFPLNNSNPFIATDCRENTGSFDPNDKQALPKGYAAGHLIEKNTPIDYTIRFQNTGTDTAFRVVIIDTLSSALSARSVRPGAASNPYRFELLGGKMMRITFDKINLPDSSVSQEGSRGFIQFNVQQAPDNADGVKIFNTAAIYFDGNQPVITNQTFHTVGTNFIVLSTNASTGGLPKLQVYPNPASDRVYFNAEGWSGGPVNFQLTDVQGKLILEKDEVRFPLVLDRGQLAAGVYLYRMNDGVGRMLWSGKMLVR